MELCTLEKKSVLIPACGGSYNLHVNILNNVDLNIKINLEIKLPIQDYFPFSSFCKSFLLKIANI